MATEAFEAAATADDNDEGVTHRSKLPSVSGLVLKDAVSNVNAGDALRSGVLKAWDPNTGVGSLESSPEIGTNPLNWLLGELYFQLTGLPIEGYSVEGLALLVDIS